MEHDCLIAYGANMMILERLMISSDQFQIQVRIASTRQLLGIFIQGSCHQSEILALQVLLALQVF